MHQIGGLPSALIDNAFEAKQFDVVVLGADFALLRGDARFAQYQEQITGIAAALEAISANVGVVRAELALILEIQTEEYWQNIDAWTLEQARRCAASSNCCASMAANRYSPILKIRLARA